MYMKNLITQYPSQQIARLCHKAHLCSWNFQQTLAVVSPIADTSHMHEILRVWLLLDELNHNSKNANASVEERAESGMWSLEVSILQHCQSPASPSVVLAVLQMHMATGKSTMFKVEKRTTLLQIFHSKIKFQQNAISSVNRIYLVYHDKAVSSSSSSRERG